MSEEEIFTHQKEATLTALEFKINPHNTYGFLICKICGNASEDVHMFLGRLYVTKTYQQSYYPLCTKCYRLSEYYPSKFKQLFWRLWYRK